MVTTNTGWILQNTKFSRCSFHIKFVAGPPPPIRFCVHNDPNKTSYHTHVTDLCSQLLLESEQRLRSLFYKRPLNTELCCM